jgi:hypothetical protein
MSASSDFWDASHFNLRDPINEEIWKKSQKLQTTVQSWQDLQSAGSVGAQQAMFGRAVLPWVPDLVGQASHKPEGVIVCGSAYAGFIHECSTRRCGLPFSRYANARSVAEFQRDFLECVVSTDQSYYDAVRQLLCIGNWKSEQLLLTDLCRVSFVCRGSDERRKDRSGDRIARSQPEVFQRYVDATAGWTWRRFGQSQASCILALGTIAEHGLLRLFTRDAMTVRSVSDRKDWSFLSGHRGGWVSKYADANRKLGYWLSKSDYWIIEGKINGHERVLHLLPVRHPARCPDYSCYQKTLKLIREKSGQ